VIPGDTGVAEKEHAADWILRARNDESVTIGLFGPEMIFQNLIHRFALGES
jgi:hypothetical protein